MITYIAILGLIRLKRLLIFHLRKCLYTDDRLNITELVGRHAEYLYQCRDMSRSF